MTIGLRRYAVFVEKSNLICEETLQRTMYVFWTSRILSDSDNVDRQLEETERMHIEQLQSQRNTLRQQTEDLNKLRKQQQIRRQFQFVALCLSYIVLIAFWTCIRHSTGNRYDDL